MPTDSIRDAAFCDVLNRELVCALGCTEPIAVAYAAALASQTLGCEPEHMDVACSGNIIKNVKSVTVPNSGGMHGIEAAAVLGAVGGDAKSALEVLESVNDTDRARVAELLADAGYCDVSLVEGVPNLYIKVTATAGGHTAVVEITDYHTNVTCHTLDGVPVCGKSAGECAACAERVVAERATGSADTPMSIESIIDFIEGGDIEGARAAVERQIELNGAISAEGLAHAWGAEVGRTLLGARADDVACRARARAAAGSDARMNGCALPVAIVCGSGNQGITCALPVMEYAEYLRCDHERLDAVRPYRRAYQELYRCALGVLRCYLRRVRRRRCDYLAVRWHARADWRDGFEHARQRGRHRVRWRQGKLCRQDFRCR